MTIGFLIAGFVLLVLGANFLVDGASSVARRLGVSDLVVGLTIVAFGTSAPELLVGVVAAGQGTTDIAVGNALGSNLFNILIILGLSGVIRPLTIQQSTVWKEIPLGLLAAVLIAILGNDVLIDGADRSILSRGDGLVLLSFFVIFIYYVVGMAGKTRQDRSGEAGRLLSMPVALGLLVVGAGGLALGAKWVVDSAVQLATQWGVAQSVIGLTIVATGTSLPELATSAVASFKNKADVAVGNIVGSNIFNIFLILGVAATVHPLPMGAYANFDVGAVVLASLLLFVFAKLGFRYHQLERWECAILLGLYGAYLWIILGQNRPL